jgi:hypothetical protein
VARWALMRCRRFRSASLWLLPVPLRVVAASGEHSPSIATSAASSIPTGTTVLLEPLAVSFFFLKGREAGSRWLAKSRVRAKLRTRQQPTS